ncbi:DUF1203 domain-containing protein [Octadecabacter sp. G9-8]|uniref:DUF1203 domain-containing protein n=1 Tax=Octadecabacter dasysiphoniae TaxID=2909341 RepID=A0ABS9CU72_9RHOB|nr:DUF1203 domain-containing protein [Octadecabacter dasysiphoniae]MCF2869954.1 DUF1203 domain-containing protein [Octadecabacter dasysiphoniae]
MRLTYSGLPTAHVHDIKNKGRDSYDLPLEVQTSDGGVHPCRHCLGAVPEGEPYLILAHRPFDGLNAYTETGPIFLCAGDCAPYAGGDVVPETLVSPTYLVRGYTGDERIKYGTGSVVPRNDIMAYAARVLDDPEIGFVDVRSAMNNCWQGRITRGD